MKNLDFVYETVFERELLDSSIIMYFSGDSCKHVRTSPENTCLWVRPRRYEGNKILRSSLWYVDLF